jgi:hypothetical protein
MVSGTFASLICGTLNGDYTKEKKELLGDPSLDQLIADIQSGEFNN